MIDASFTCKLHVIEDCGNSEALSTCMLFDVQEDLGSKITAYMVPDAGGKIPSIRVLNDGIELLTLAADHLIPALVAAGRHTTGLCGFTVDEALVPGLSTMQDLELVEEETGLLVYRRPQDALLDGVKMFRLETHLLPLWRLDDALKPRFQHWYKGIERHGRETSTQVFCLKNSKSSYVSGRLLYKNYEYYLYKGVKTIALLRDPYNELAERLMILKNVGSRAEMILGARDAINLGPVMKLLGEVDDFSYESCKKLFKKAPKALCDALSNPLVRQLTASTPDELPGRAAVAASLEILASFHLVGLRSHAEDFRGALAEAVGVEETELPALGEHQRLNDLSQHLREFATVESFLEQDLELFQIVQSAFHNLVP